MTEIDSEMEEPGFMCVLPWINLHVATSGAISPCCEFKGEVANLKHSTLEEAWQGPELAGVRRAFREGVRLEACRKCIDREASEGSSLRLQSNRRFATALRQISAADNPPPAPAFPTALDLRFSNLCNFRCRSCWHGASSRWFADAKALGRAIGDKAEISSFETVDEFMRQVEPGLPQLSHIYFAGGEPLMQPEHYALLERLIALGRTNLSLAYNTNMSVLSHKGRSILDLWSQFPRVEVEASVDAAGELGAIIRKGFDWKVFADNVKAVRERCPHVSIRFGVTVSVMNIRALPDLVAALVLECGATFADVYLHSLQDPSYYRSQALPPPLKADAERRLRRLLATLPAGAPSADLARQIEGVIRFMNAADLSYQFPRVIQVTGKLDRLRDEPGISTLFPDVRLTRGQ